MESIAMKNLILIVGIIMLFPSCGKFVMSCAGILSYSKCAKFCTQKAVAVCEETRKLEIGQTQREIQEGLNPSFRFD